MRILAIEAARLGQGVALANEMLVEDDLSTGALVEVVPSDLRLCGYYLSLPAAARWDEPADEGAARVAARLVPLRGEGTGV